MHKKPKIQFFTSGYCTGNMKHVQKGAPSKKTNFYAIWALIQHPELGNILFDTGYSRQFYRATRKFPDRVYKWITPVFVEEDETCISKLIKLDIEAININNIVISHFHADHIGGLKDFPDSQIWCSGASLKFVKDNSSGFSVLKGILKELIPPDIQERSKHPEKIMDVTYIGSLKAWKWSDDIYFVDLPGHFRGQLGLFVQNTDKGDILLCADAVWTLKSIKEKLHPPKLTAFIADDFKILCNTIDLLNEFHLNNQDVVIIPTHCEETRIKLKIK